MITTQVANYMSMDEIAHFLQIKRNYVPILLKNFIGKGNFITMKDYPRQKFFPIEIINNIKLKRLQHRADEWEENGELYVSEEKASKMVGLTNSRIRYKVAPIKLSPPFTSVRRICFKKSDIENFIIKRAIKSSQLSESLAQFYETENPRIAYLFGFIWADGYVPLFNAINGTISINIQQTDMNDIKWLIQSTSNRWKFKEKVYSNPNYKKQEIAILNSFEISRFLNNYDYLPKTSKSACKILARLDEKYHYLFFRALVDGDGCWQKGKNHVYMICASNKYQDWTFFTNFLDKHGITYKIKTTTRIQANGISAGGSLITISKSLNIFKLGEVLYPNGNNEGIGLSRKYKQWLEIKEYILNRPIIKKRYAKELGLI